jgi:hypothetical protein
MTTPKMTTNKVMLREKIIDMLWAKEGFYADRIGSVKLADAILAEIRGELTFNIMAIPIKDDSHTIDIEDVIQSINECLGEECK